MAQSNEPTLAELSKQARERKAKTQKPARLITNADLKNFQNAPVSMSKAAPEAQPADQTAAEAKTADRKTAEPGADAVAAEKKQAEWKAKFREKVLDYKNAVQKGAVLQLRLNNMTNAFYAQTDDAMRARYGAEIDQTTKEIENNKGEIAVAQKALEDLKAEARAAGIEEAEISSMIGELPKPVTITDLEGEQQKLE